MRAFRTVLLTLLVAFAVASGRGQDAPPPPTAAVGDASQRLTQLEEENKRLRADADFARRRMALLEEDAERLRGVVKARQEADDLAANRTKREEIQREVERLRELRFLQPVDFHEIPRTQLPVVLRQKLAQQVPDTEFENAGIALSALGVLPANIDLKKTYLALLGEQIGAFYDQHEKQLFTFSGSPLSAMQNRVIMAHELTHALEDQHFNLSGLPIEAKNNDDRVLATTALVEGDATLVMNRYMVGDLSAASLRDALASSLTTDVRQLASAPRYLRETLLFPYLRGQEFCDALYARGGWEALGEAFRHPPKSSSQILHPALYLAEPREDPIEVPFPALEILGEKPVEDNVLGEFGARQLFLAWLHDEHRASDVAAGWRGDRYVVYRQDDASSYVWRIACRDQKSTKEFYDALNALTAARYPSANVHRGSWKREVTVNGKVAEKPMAGPVFYTVSQLGERKLECAWTLENEVLIVDAQNERWWNALSERFARKFWLHDEN